MYITQHKVENNYFETNHFKIFKTAKFWFLPVIATQHDTTPLIQNRKYDKNTSSASVIFGQSVLDLL